jgi:hypothetical protein
MVGTAMAAEELAAPSLRRSYNTQTHSKYQCQESQMEILLGAKHIQLHGIVLPLAA